MGSSAPRGVTLGAVFAAMGAACQLVAGIDDRAVAPTDDASVGNDGATATDAAASEASADASDAPRSDAGALDGDAPYCASFDAASYVFCDDFDQPGRTSVTDTGWGPINGVPLGVIVRDASFSPPASVQFAFNAADGGANSAAAKSVSVLAPNTTLVVSAMILVGKGTVNGAMTISAPSCSIEWDAVGDIAAYCPAYVGLGTTGAVPSETWVPRTLTLTASSGHVHVHAVSGTGAQMIVWDGDMSTPTPLLQSAQLFLGNPDDTSNGVLGFDNVLLQTY